MKTNFIVPAPTALPRGHKSAGEAALIAGILGDQPNLRTWLLGVVAPLGWEGTALLARAARTLRTEFTEFATAGLLDRLAADGTLRSAVFAELRTNSPEKPGEPHHA